MDQDEEAPSKRTNKSSPPKAVTKKDHVNKTNDSDIEDEGELGKDKMPH